MVTIYNLLEVEENASKEEIEKAYQNLLLEYQTNPVLSVEENRQNEMILNKLKMAYEIVMNDEKRKRYDSELAKKRAEELIRNVPESSDESRSNQDKEEQNDAEEKNNMQTQKSVEEENKEEGEIYYDIPKVKNTRYKEPNEEEDEVTITKEEKKKLRKAAQKEFNTNLKRAQKIEEEYSNAYNEAYNKYLKKMGYNTQESTWTLKRVKNIFITIFAIILVCAVAWFTPPTRKILINVYETNFIVKSLVDIVGILVESIISIFK